MISGSVFSVGAMVVLFIMFVKLGDVHLELICTLFYYAGNKGLFQLQNCNLSKYCTVT